MIRELAALAALGLFIAAVLILWLGREVTCTYISLKMAPAMWWM
jgi:hypothetical protein